MRWLIAVVLAVFVAGTGPADAQAFKPRGGSKASAKTPAKKASAKKATPKKAAKSSKKRSRAAQSSARPDDLTPDEDAPSKKSSKASNPEDEDDYVLIEDD